MNILKKADEIINQRSEEKERQYGPMADTMQRMQLIFNAMTGKNLPVEDMYIAMVAMKMARNKFAYKQDNLLDAVAYIGALDNILKPSGQLAIKWKEAYTGPEKNVVTPVLKTDDVRPANFDTLKAAMNQQRLKELTPEDPNILELRQLIEERRKTTKRISSFSKELKMIGRKPSKNKLIQSLKLDIKKLNKRINCLYLKVNT